MNKFDQRPVQMPVEVIRLFQGFVKAAIVSVRRIIQTVRKYTPMIQKIVDQKNAQRKRIVRLSYRKKKSQAKNWRKWKRRRNR